MHVYMHVIDIIMYGGQEGHFFKDPCLSTALDQIPAAARVVKSVLLEHRISLIIGMID